LVAKVALVDVGGDASRSLRQALDLLGGLGDLNSRERAVVVKVGVFSPKSGMYPKADVVGGIVGCFPRAPRIAVAESDNTRGSSLARLQIYEHLFDQRVGPYDLSGDANTRAVRVGGEVLEFSQVLFKPNVFVSTHALRRYDKGTILKNLLGLIPEKKKARFHKKLVVTLLDTFEAIGGVDLAVLDATTSYSGPGARRRANTKALIVGKDAVAVEAVGAKLVGLNLDKMPIIQEAMKRGLGEGNLERIEILGEPFERVRSRFQALHK
jgi:uncharacterized protein (DUF362 family)